MEELNLTEAINRKDWNEASRLFKKYPQVVPFLGFDTFGILWDAAPFEVIRTLVKACPDAHWRGPRNLVETKCIRKEWHFLDRFFEEFPDAKILLYDSLQAEIDQHVEKSD